MRCDVGVDEVVDSLLETDPQTAAPWSPSGRVFYVLREEDPPSMIKAKIRASSLADAFNRVTKGKTSVEVETNDFIAGMNTRGYVVSVGSTSENAILGFGYVVVLNARAVQNDW